MTVATVATVKMIPSKSPSLSSLSSQYDYIADSNNYRYDQSGGVVKISSKTDKTYDGSKYFSGGISNCDKVYVSDGSLEIEAYRLVGSTPIISEESLKRIAISKAMDASGNEVSSPSVEDINNYRYILIEPIYCYLYQLDTE